MATKKKQRKKEDENREFKVEWTENFAFIQNLNGLPACLICKEKFMQNKKSNLVRHFTRKQASFSAKYPTGDARKKAVEELQKSLDPKEELLGLLPLKSQTRGEDITNAVIECMDKHHNPLDKIVSIPTDGSKSMTGVRKGFVAILKEKINHEILVYHRIIHQEELCAQTFQNEICKVMELVITIINSILAKALNHRQFKEFLFEMESEYADLLLHNKVRWLSRGNVLKRFASLFPEIKAFLLEKGVHYPELTDDQWIQNFYFMVTSHQNHLNRKLQGKGNFIFSILEEVITFENKLSIFAQDFEREILFHFPSLLKHRQENNSSINKHHFKAIILNMSEAFLGRFQEFKNSRATLVFVKNPLNARITELKCSSFENDIGSFEI
ncbi:general transcription factor II-I repeat domain-containing protein 2A [Trichonephila clavipes]|nr:general transcription factor II-I repeat domain-containing protein 2A [Trichonephila clavipes]